MKVALIAPLPFSLAFGGLQVQLIRTAEALTSLGIEVELLDPWKPRFDANLLHCFGSEYQMEEVVSRARARGIPIVVSAVFLRRKRALFYRLWRRLDPLLPLKTSFGSRSRILRSASAIIALTPPEAADLVRFFGADRRKIHIVPNGVDERFFTASPVEFRTRYGLGGFILCVGSLEARKNQHRLVRAITGTDLPVVLLGPPSASEPGYAKQVAAAMRRDHGMLWIEGVPHDSSLLPSAYAAAAVMVLPSLIEVQPLAVLEAAAAGANLVISDLPYLRDAFGDYAWYCDPRSTRSIRQAVLAAHRASRGARYASRPAWLVPWSEVSRRLREIYHAVLTQESAGSKDARPAGHTPGAIPS